MIEITDQPAVWYRRKLFFGEQPYTITMDQMQQQHQYFGDWDLLSDHDCRLALANHLSLEDAKYIPALKFELASSTYHSRLNEVIFGLMLVTDMPMKDLFKTKLTDFYGKRGKPLETIKCVDELTGTIRTVSLAPIYEYLFKYRKLRHTFENDAGWMFPDEKSHGEKHLGLIKLKNEMIGDVQKNCYTHSQSQHHYSAVYYALQGIDWKTSQLSRVPARVIDYHWED